VLERVDEALLRSVPDMGDRGFGGEFEWARLHGRSDMECREAPSQCWHQLRGMVAQRVLARVGPVEPDGEQPIDRAIGSTVENLGDREKPSRPAHPSALVEPVGPPVGSTNLQEVLPAAAVFETPSCGGVGPLPRNGPSPIPIGGSDVFRRLERHGATLRRRTDRAYRTSLLRRRSPAPIGTSGAPGSSRPASSEMDESPLRRIRRCTCGSFGGATGWRVF
jgi:hypothetical protein